MINPTWDQKPLGCLFEIGAGKTMSAAARDHENRIPFLRTSNVLWDEINLGKLDEMHFTEAELEDKSLKAGDLLVCEGGDIGRAAVWTSGPERISFQNHLHRLRKIDPNVEPRFYVYFLQSAFTQLGIFAGVGNDTTISNLSKNRLLSLDVPHPERDEQKDIVLCLSIVRDAISLHEKATSIALELKHTSMRELFTCGLKGEAKKESEIGPIPESWDLKPIVQLCEILSGGTPRKSRKEFWGGTIPWASGKDLKVPVLHDTGLHLTELGSQSGTRIVPEDSILILVRGMGLAKDLPVSVISRPMAFNQDVKALLVRGNYPGLFLRSAIYNSKDRLLSRIVPSAHGTMTLNLDDIETFKVAVPQNSTDAEEIARVIEAIDAKVDLHKRKKAILEDLFKSLLHKLMTGEIRVSDLDLSALKESSEVAA